MVASLAPCSVGKTIIAIAILVAAITAKAAILGTCLLELQPFCLEGFFLLLEFSGLGCPHLFLEFFKALVEQLLRFLAGLTLFVFEALNFGLHALIALVVAKLIREDELIAHTQIGSKGVGAKLMRIAQRKHGSQVNAHIHGRRII